MFEDGDFGIRARLPFLFPQQRYLDHLEERIDSPVTLVIPLFLRRISRRIYAAIFSFWTGVIPPLPMLGRS